MPLIDTPRAELRQSSRPNRARLTATTTGYGAAVKSRLFLNGTCEQFGAFGLSACARRT